MVFTGLGLLAPQLYLAATASDRTMRRRYVRNGLLVSGLLTLAAGSGGLGGGDALLVVGGGLLGALFVYEGMHGYRESSLFEDASAE
ncbi:MAG: hypothetical protein ABEJ94_09180 [Halorientalis sp.]